MFKLFKRDPRPAARIEPTLERDSKLAIEVKESDEEADWALWHDSVQSFESSRMPLDPFEGVGRRDR